MSNDILIDNATAASRKAIQSMSQINLTEDYPEAIRIALGRLPDPNAATFFADVLSDVLKATKEIKEVKLPDVEPKKKKQKTGKSKPRKCPTKKMKWETLVNLVNELALKTSHESTEYVAHLSFLANFGKTSMDVSKEDIAALDATDCAFKSTSFLLQVQRGVHYDRFLRANPDMSLRDFARNHTKFSASVVSKLIAVAGIVDWWPRLVDLRVGYDTVYEHRVQLQEYLMGTPSIGNKLTSFHGARYTFHGEHGSQLKVDVDSVDMQVLDIATLDPNIDKRVTNHLDEGSETTFADACLIGSKLDVHLGLEEEEEEAEEAPNVQAEKAPTVQQAPGDAPKASKDVPLINLGNLNLGKTKLMDTSGSTDADIFKISDEMPSSPLRAAHC